MASKIEEARGQGAVSGAAWLSLLASSGTLVCCVLPAVLVAVGAGATLAALVTRFPQLIWLSEHKGAVFAIAGALLLAAGGLQWWARRLPCPADPAARRTCMRSRRIGAVVFAVAAVAYIVGLLFAFVLPVITR